MRLAIVIALVTSACSTSYVPRARGRVALTMQHGTYVYVRDGQSYPQGVLGGGLADAVRGNPGAVAAAETYHSRMVTGFVAMMLGLAGEVGGLAYSVSSLDHTSSRDATLGAAALFGGLALMLVGSSCMASAEPYRWDALNLFNDGGDVPLGPPGAGPAPASAISLKMRD